MTFDMSTMDVKGASIGRNDLKMVCKRCQEYVPRLTVCFKCGEMFCKECVVGHGLGCLPNE